MFIILTPHLNIIFQKSLFNKVTVTHISLDMHINLVFYFICQVSFWGMKASLQIQPKLILQSKSKMVKIWASQKKNLSPYCKFNHHCNSRIRCCVLMFINNNNSNNKCLLQCRFRRIKGNHIHVFKDSKNKFK